MVYTPQDDKFHEKNELLTQILGVLINHTPEEFKPFIIDVHNFYKTFGYITDKQFNCLRKSYRKGIKKQNLLNQYLAQLKREKS